VAKKAAKKPAKPGLAMGHKLLILVVLVVFAMVWPTLVGLLAIGMLPSIAAYLVDRTPQKHAAFSVGGMNFCGVFPYLMELWNTGADLADFLAILGNVFALLVMCAAAAFGWLLYAAVPPMVTMTIKLVNQRKIAGLRRRQKQIVAEWGDGVAGAANGTDSPESPGQQPAAA